MRAVCAPPGRCAMAACVPRRDRPSGTLAGAEPVRPARIRSRRSPPQPPASRRQASLTRGCWLTGRRPLARARPRSRHLAGSRMPPIQGLISPQPRLLRRSRPVRRVGRMRPSPRLVSRPMPVRLPGRGHRLARRAIRTRSGPSRTRLGPAPSSLSLRHSSGPTGRRSRAQVRPGQDSELTRPPPPRQWPQPKRIQLPSRPGLRRVRPSSPGLRRVRTSSPGLRRVRLSSPGLRRVRTRANRVRLSATSPPAPRGPRSPKGPGRSWRRSAGRRCSRLARLATRLGSRARSPGGCRIRPHHGPRSSRRRCACGCGGTCRGAAPRQVRKQPGAPAPLGGWCCCASRWHSSRQPR